MLAIAMDYWPFSDFDFVQQARPARRRVEVEVVPYQRSAQCSISSLFPLLQILPCGSRYTESYTVHSISISASSHPLALRCSSSWHSDQSWTLTTQSTGISEHPPGSTTHSHRPAQSRNDPAVSSVARGLLIYRQRSLSS